MVIISAHFRYYVLQFPSLAQLLDHSDFSSETSFIYLTNLQKCVQRFQSVIGFHGFHNRPSFFSLWWNQEATAAPRCPYKPQKKSKKTERTASGAKAKETGVDAALAAELDGIFTFKEEQKWHWVEKMLLLHWLALGKRSLRPRSALQRWHTSVVTLCTNKKPGAVAICQGWFDLSPWMWQTEFVQLPSYLCLPFLNTFNGFSTRWIREINPKV